jgi:hypothetical protein
MLFGIALIAIMKGKEKLSEIVLKLETEITKTKNL